MAYKPGRCLLLLRLAERGLTQQELASRLYMPRAQINDYAMNRKIMSLKNAKSIAAVLECRIDDLYEWIPVPPSKRSRRKYE